MFKAKPYIVAEVGSNFQTLEHCLWSICVAAQAGADAVKFQLFDLADLYGPGVKPGPYGCAQMSQIRDWLPALKAECDRFNVDLGVTAFSPELVKVVDPYVKWHKVASSDAAWPQMLDAVAACGKPVLLSTGAKTNDEVRRASHLLACKVPVVRLVCVAAYPADYVPLDPFATGADGLGLSDHSLGYSVPVEAAKCGAVVIEKHFTAFPDMDTPDRPHSLTPAQFTAMVKLIRTGEAPDQERDMRLRHNRRLIATRDIAPRETLKYGENFGAYRSLEDDHYGASPFDWEKVEGKAAKREIKRGTGIAVGDAE